ncbi:Phage repressor protein C, contains Cro/C1-type HTH and peptisase s24 domains [Tistlia consotensis]|uniref:Phage repressor protein C, contains Cro/C1-type HTH and peptisase s24 domains n=1 Tax=Tistlia consotensis USBA 355 TaxID=560819 RepID=A0A1Y6B7C0_9PROT|nr:S24 family peptidase [Tistlia consotensis]SME96800.1 Phage repressor protein C, contains Cro/C1-type HTH and peptisase s24 domains [Tistlia consotensis USBA 355]SNR56174.1 Phage repressor protein C, contains Cro/C1-type HTH and peptisase s24 domains [Tistlia consotensis]
MSLAAIVRLWRQERRLSQPQLAKLVGVSQQAIQQLESGETRTPRYLVRLAREMGADPEALLDGRLEPAAGARAAAAALAAAAPPLPNATAAAAASFGARDLPVYASAQGGPEGMMVSYEPIEWIERPAPLAGVPSAFAMYVVNDSMEPRYRQGDLLLVHPQRPVKRGQDVLVIRASDESQHAAYVKELVALDEARVRLRQLNPPGEFELERGLVVGLHLVVGVYYGG